MLPLCNIAVDFKLPAEHAIGDLTERLVGIWNKGQAIYDFRFTQYLCGEKSLVVAGHRSQLKIC